MSDARNDGRRGFGELLRELAEGSAALVRQEVRLARLEVKEMFAGVGKGTAFVATGGVLALLGSLSVFAGFIMLVGDQWLRDNYWLAALLVTIAAGAVAAWFARQGMRMLSPAALTPDQTIATLKEDKEWLRRQLTSGATSR